MLRIGGNVQTEALRSSILLSSLFRSITLVKYRGASFGTHANIGLAHQPLLPSTKSDLLSSRVRFQEMLDNKHGVITRGSLDRHVP